MRAALHPAVLILLAAGLACAQEAPPADEGVIVLFNGQVLSGRLAAQGDRTVVSSRGIEAQIRNRDIEFRGATLVDCYVQKARKVAAADAEGRLKLATWCVDNRLFRQAQAELKIAVAQLPGDPRVDRLERRLAAEQNAVQRASATVPAKSQPAALDMPTLSLPIRPALAPELVADFAQRIQPLLVNHCGAGRCHGPRGKSEFNLERMPANRIVGRQLTQGNLEQVRDQIDAANPAASPLLVRPLEASHGGRASIFASKNDRRYRDLKAWVERVATSEQITPAQPAAVADAPAATVANPPPEMTAPAEPPKLAAAEDKSGVQRGVDLSGWTPADPFDPEIFNREQHNKSDEGEASSDAGDPTSLFDPEPTSPE